MFTRGCVYELYCSVGYFYARRYCGLRLSVLNEETIYLNTVKRFGHVVTEKNAQMFSVRLSQLCTRCGVSAAVLV